MCLPRAYLGGVAYKFYCASSLHSASSLEKDVAENGIFTAKLLDNHLLANINVSPFTHAITSTLMAPTIHNSNRLGAVISNPEVGQTSWTRLPKSHWFSRQNDKNGLKTVSPDLMVFYRCEDISSTVGWFCSSADNPEDTSGIGPDDMGQLVFHVKILENGRGVEKVPVRNTEEPSEDLGPIGFYSPKVSLLYAYWIITIKALGFVTIQILPHLALNLCFEEIKIPLTLLVFEPTKITIQRDNEIIVSNCEEFSINNKTLEIAIPTDGLWNQMNRAFKEHPMFVPFEFHFSNDKKTLRLKSLLCQDGRPCGRVKIYDGAFVGFYEL